jgi:hypothetical protein
MNATMPATTTTSHLSPMAERVQTYPQNVPTANVVYAFPLMGGASDVSALMDRLLGLQRTYQANDRVRDRLHEAEDHLKRALTALRVAERQALLG